MLRTLMLVLVALTSLVGGQVFAAETVCVLYFDNNTGDKSWDPLKKGLADMVVSDLAGLEGLTVVERSRLEDVLGELKLQRSSQFDPATAQKLGKLVGARFAVTGSISAVAPKIRIDVRLIEVESGKVIVADKVVGDPNRFFDLQANLLSVFAKSLGKALPARASVARLDKLDTALLYGRGLDLSDQDDTEAASKALKEVVKAAPKFALGQSRYLDIMRRLQEAKAKRATELQSGEKALLAKCDAELKKGPVNRLKGDKLGRYLGYRVLRGNVLHGMVTQLAGRKEFGREASLAPAKHAAGKALMLAYVDNQETLARELATLGRNGIPAFPRIDDADKDAGEELGLGMNPELHAFMNFQVIARSTARYLVLGGPGLFASHNLDVSPSLAEMDPTQSERALALLDKALDDITQHEGKSLKEREMTRTLDLYGDLLLVLGRPAEAIARWQQVLDDYPKSTEFADIEKKIRAVLEKPR